MGILRSYPWKPTALAPSSAYTLVSFGGLYAVFLAISYAPTIVIIEDVRKELIAKIMSLPIKGEMSSDWCEHREVIERVLLPRNSLGTGIRVGIAIFAPIIVALAT